MEKISNYSDLRCFVVESGTGPGQFSVVATTGVSCHPWVSTRTLFLTSFRYINRSLLLLLLLQQQLLKDPHLYACSINVSPLPSPHFSFLLLIINTFLNALLLQQQAVMEIVETLDSVRTVASWQSNAVGEVSFKKACLNVIELFTVVCDAFWIKLSLKGWKSVVELPEMHRTNSSRPSLRIISGKKHQKPAVYATTCVARNCCQGSYLWLLNWGERKKESLWVDACCSRVYADLGRESEDQRFVGFSLSLVKLWSLGLGKKKEPSWFSLLKQAISDFNRTGSKRTKKEIESNVFHSKWPFVTCQHCTRDEQEEPFWFWLQL